jgi:O-methyltransferase involved in polyketide biosynthesis
VVWLGVVVYRSLEAIETTLREVSELAAPGSRLLASYSIPREMMDSDSREFDDLARAAATSGGEPHTTFLSPEQMEGRAQRAGWRTVRSVNPVNLSRYYANRTDDLSPVSYEWFLVADA